MHRDSSAETRFGEFSRLGARAGLVLGLWFSSCAAPVAWRESSGATPATWRHCRVFQGPAATVLAPEEPAAAKLHELAATLGRELEQALGRPAPRGLWIAVEADGPLPTGEEDVGAWWLTLRRWHEELIDSRLETPDDGAGEDADGPTIDRGVLARCFASPAPRDAVELGLPAVLAADAAYVVLVPTDASLAAGAARMFEAAQRAHPLSMTERAMLAALGARPETLLREELAKTRRIVIARSALSVMELEPELAATAAVKLGLPGRVGADDSAELSASEVAARAAQALERDYRMPPPESDAARSLRLCTGPRPERELASALAAGPWRAIVDLGPGPKDDLSRRVAAAGGRYLRLEERNYVPSRETIDRLAEFLREHPEELTLVCDITGDRAALLVAGYAFHHRGFDAASALALARHYGATDPSPLAPALVRDAGER